MKKLILIQSELKAPKNQFNSFGKYKYRNCEDILEAVKPLLKKHDCILTITDEIELIGSYLFVRATCKFSDGENSVMVNALAKHPESKKGMDDSQITGAASSYARKYALNGLFLIDDSKDADSQQPEKKIILKKDSESWNNVKRALNKGYTIADIKAKYIVSHDLEKELLK